jgi:hypothetical protein
MRRIASVALGATLAAAFYLLLIDTTSSPELYAMAVVAVLAGIAFAAARDQGASMSIRGRWLLRGWRVLARVPADTGLLCRDAVAQLFTRRRTRGVFRTVPFHGGERPIDEGRRAVSESLGSFAPNTIVIGVDTERELLLVHQLHRRGDGDELDTLRLG